MKSDWKSLLSDQFTEDYYTELDRFVTRERREHEVHPAPENVFAALDATSCADTKVMILGQDPYHGPGQANGLCFSVARGVAIPPSLRNIFAEMHSDLDIATPAHGDLSAWAARGVLLLNTTLTVRSGEAGSHQGRGWETFTDRIITLVNEKSDPVVFILWGAHAGRKKRLITAGRHVVIEGPHPSPLSAHRGFFGSRPFSRTNEALVAMGREPIDWSIPD